LAEQTHDSGLAALAADTPNLHLTSDLTAAYSRQHGESTVVAAWRQDGARALADTPLPDRVRHLWRYTDPQRLLPRSLLGAATALAPADLAPARRQLAELEAQGRPAVLVVSGQAPELNASALASGLIITPLAEAAESERLGQAVPAEHGYFEALNAGAWTGGLVIRAPGDLALAEPLRVLLPAAAGQDLLPRLLIIAESCASLTVVEEHTGGGAGGTVVGVTELLLEAGAQLRHVLVQQWADGQVGHLTQRARLERDAGFVGVTAGLGASLAKLDLGAILAGPGARSELVGVTLPCGRQHLDHHTVHQHLSGQTWSNIDFKVAVFDRARSAYTGLIRIEKDAPVTEAYQENRNLLMSDRARADTIPELEILTDEVSCSHGATVAPIEPEQLFYLQSRGLPGDAARRLIVRGFVEPTLRLLPVGVREEIESLIEARLDGLRRSG